VNTAGDASDM